MVLALGVGFAGSGMDGVITSEALPAQQGNIHIEGIQLDGITNAAHPLGGQQGGATPQKGVEDDIAAAGTIENSIRHHLYRLHRGV